MIYQLYKKQVEAWKERFNPLDPDVRDRDNEILSSRHKDTIELLEAEIERRRGKKVGRSGYQREASDDFNRDWRKNFELAWKNGDFNYANVNEISPNRVADFFSAIRFSDLCSAIDEDIAYLEGELRKLKNEQ